MSINQPKRTIPATKGVNKLLNSCTLAIGVGLIIIMLSCLAFIGVPKVVAQYFWQTNHARWVNTGSSNYAITVEIGGGMEGEHQEIIDVQHGKLISHQCTRPCFSTFFNNLPVDELFNEASDCTGFLLSCSVEYDALYGYPKSIRYATCIECFVAWTHVLQLQINPQILEF
jgi:hypothetical protein